MTWFIIAFGEGSMFRHCAKHQHYCTVSWRIGVGLFIFIYYIICWVWEFRRPDSGARNQMAGSQTYYGLCYALRLCRISFFLGLNISIIHSSQHQYVTLTFSIPIIIAVFLQFAMPSAHNISWWVGIDSQQSEHCVFIQNIFPIMSIWAVTQIRFTLNFHSVHHGLSQYHFREMRDFLLKLYRY